MVMASFASLSNTSQGTVMTKLTLADLDRLYEAPTQRVIDKVLDHVDGRGRAFIGLSPFCVVSAAGPDGTMDVSPRGGEPGFVHVSEDGRMVFLPDRRGNNRLDVLRNLLGGDGRIGLMFMIPGVDDIWRVNGRASVSEEPQLLERFVEFGRPPRVVLSVAVEEAYGHCPKALMRARLWDPEARVDRDSLQTGVTPEEHAATIERYRGQL
jgi:PPOX class probable FMN-dependent enzyme